MSYASEFSNISAKSARPHFADDFQSAVDVSISNPSAPMSLYEAIKANDVLLLRQLLRAGENANQAVDNGRTLLTWTVESGAVPVIRALLEGGADATAHDANGEDALDRAVAAKRRNVVDLLTPYFPAGRIEEAIQRLPYYRKVTQSLAGKQEFEHPFFKLSAREEQAAVATTEERELVAAAEKGDTDTVQRLLTAGVNPEAAAPSMVGGATPLWAAIYNRRPAAIRLLANAGANLDDALPEAPLFDEVEAGRAETVRALAEGGADLNIKSSRGNTLLRAAIESGHPEIVTELLRLGADPDLPSTYNAPRSKGLTPLQVAAMMCDGRSFEAIQAAGATDPKPDTLRLCVAAQSGQLEVVKRLIEDGIKVNEKDSLQRTPLVCAAAAGNMKVARYLLERGANANAASGRGMGGATPLLAAVMANKLKLVQMLVESGADLDFKGDEGMTALEYAKRAHLKKVAAYLQDVHVSRGGSAAPAGTDMRGVPTFDVNDSCLLFESGVEQVAAQLKKHIGATIWKKNVIRKSATLTEHCYGVVRFVGIPWTGVMRLNCPINQYPSASDAQVLSKTLKTRAIHIASGDTAGVAQYALFDNGTLQEFFGFSSLLGDEGGKPHLEQHFGIDLVDFDDVERKGDTVFVSRLRKVDLSTIENHLDFINDFVNEQNALAPMFPENGGDTGEETEFEFEDFADDEIERLDFVAAP